MNHRTLFAMLLLTTTTLLVHNVNADNAVAALFCEGSSNVLDADGEVYPCWTEADSSDSKSSSKSRRRRGRRLSGKGGKGGKKDECEIVEMDGEDSFDAFEDFDSVSTYLIECGSKAKAGLCSEDGDDYEVEEECDPGQEAIVTLLKLDDRRRLKGVGNSRNRRKKEVEIGGKEYVIFGYDE